MLKATPIPPEQRLLLDTQSAADLLSVGVTTLEKLPIPRYTLPGTSLKRWRREDLEMYVRDLSNHGVSRVKKAA